MLELREVSFRQHGQALLDRVDLAFAPGTITVILGPQGAGKTTLSRMLSGDCAPTTGRVVLDGESRGCTELAREVKFWPAQSHRQRLGFGLTVREVITAESAAVTADRHLDRTALEALDNVGGLALADRAYDTLSPSEALKVDLAWTLVRAPRYAVFDERTAGIDAAGRYDVVSILHRLAATGVTIVITEGGFNAEMLLADRVVVMHRGQVIADGVPEIVLAPKFLRLVFGAPCPMTAPTLNRVSAPATE